MLLHGWSSEMEGGWAFLRRFDLLVVGVLFWMVRWDNTGERGVLTPWMLLFCGDVAFCAGTGAKVCDE